MRWAPCADTPNAAVLPVFDPTWKDKCLACAHLTTHPRAVGTRNEHTMLHCASADLRGRGGKFSSRACIDIRADEGPCGPEARLFVPKPLR